MSAQAADTGADASPVPRPVGRPPGRPRNAVADTAILDAALDELAERGFGGMSIESIAQRAGVAKTTVYRRWATREDLIVDALSWLKGPIVHPPGRDVREDLVTILRGVSASWSNERHVAVMRWLAAHGNTDPELYHTQRDRLIAPYSAVLRQVLERAVAHGLIDDDADLEAVQRLLVSPAIAAGMTLRSPLSGPQIEFVVDTVLAGLRPPAAASAVQSAP